MTKKLRPGAPTGNTNAAKPAKLKRVVLPAQRVAPATLAALRKLAAEHGGIGRALDALVSRR